MEMEPNRSTKKEILDELVVRVDKCLQSLERTTDEWHANFETAQAGLLSACTRHEFEARINQLLRTLNLSHVGFEHVALDRCSAGRALAATYLPFELDGTLRWVFQDVHPDGPADRVGIRPGDILLKADQISFSPPEHPFFRMASTANLLVQDSEDRVVLKNITIPGPGRSLWTRKKDRPPAFAQPRCVSHQQMAENIGYMRLSSFPGAVGVEVANEISAALEALSDSRGLIIDLRGNGGGGVGFMRLLNHLSSESYEIGTFVTGPRSLELPTQNLVFFVLDEVPRFKIQLPFLAAHYLWKKVLSRITHKPLCIRLQAKGGKQCPFHGRTVILTNQHTASAAEMVVAAAKENELATIVGLPTAGRVRGGTRTKLPHGFWLMLPGGLFVTSKGTNPDGAPITPHVHVPFDPVAARKGQDTQLERAIEVVRSL